MMSTMTCSPALPHSPADVARYIPCIGDGPSLWGLTYEVARADFEQATSPTLRRRARALFRTLAHLGDTPLAHLPLTRLTPMDVTAYFTQRSAEVSAAVVKHECAIVARALRHTHAAWGCPVAHLLDALKHGARAALPRATPSQNDVQALIDAAAQHWGHGPLLAATVRLIADTGMRGGELLALSWADVHLDDGCLTVPGGTRTPPRRMPLSEETVLALRALGSTGEERVLGAFEEPAGLSRALQRVAKASGLPPIRLASLRSAALLRLSGGRRRKHST